MNKIVFISLASIILISIYSLSGCTDNQNNNIDGGEDFKFQGMDDNIHNLSDYRGKIVILDMWATWCTPCGYQMLELEKIYNHYNKEVIEIISIDIDSEETVNMVQDYIYQFQQAGINLNWIFGLDIENIWEKYKINGGIPTLYIFDKDGNIHYYHEGVSVFSEIPDDWPENTITLKEKIDELM